MCASVAPMEHVTYVGKIERVLSRTQGVRVDRRRVWKADVIRGRARVCQENDEIRVADCGGMMSRVRTIR